MNFITAMDEVKEKGKRVYLVGWNPEKQYVYYSSDGEYKTHFYGLELNFTIHWCNIDEYIMEGVWKEIE